MKKSLSLVVALLLSFQYALAYNDTQKYSWERSIEYLTTNGVVEGYSDDTFRPYTKINRAEFVKIVMSASLKGEIMPAPTIPCFPDVLRSAWYSSYVCEAKKQGVISGYPDGSFKPESSINQAEALKILMIAFKISTENTSFPWYKKYFDTAQNIGMLYFAGGNEAAYQIQRGEMAYLTAWLMAGESKPDQLKIVPQYVPPFLYQQTGSQHTVVMDATQVNMRVMTGNESIREKECDLPHHCVAEAQAESFQSFVDRSHKQLLVNGAFFDAYTTPLTGENFHQISSDILINGAIRSMYGWDAAFGNGGMLAQLQDQSFAFFHPVRDWMASSVYMGLSNYPYILDNGHVRTREEIGQYTANDTGFWLKIRRGGLGLSGDRQRIYYVSIVGTVEELGTALKEAGASDAFALDSGSSNAFFFDGEMIFPPARKLTTVLEFYER